MVVSESGKFRSPRGRVLNAAMWNWRILRASNRGKTPTEVSTDIKVERGLAPDAGFAEVSETRPAELALAR